MTPTVTGGAETEHHPVVYGLEGKAGVERSHERLDYVAGSRLSG